MAVTEDHFVGFDPWTEFGLDQTCPADPYGAYAIWYEKWFFTGWTWKTLFSTGINYDYSYAVFNKLGDYLGHGPWPGGPATYGLAGNDVWPPRPRTNDQWLAYARLKTNSASLPAPGTVFMLQYMTYLVGREPG